MKKKDIQVVPLVPSRDNPETDSTVSLEAMCRYAAKQGYTVYSPMRRYGSAVHINRNMLLSDLIKSRVPFTHVLWMDDDMVSDEDTLVRLIERNVDIVGGLCTNRTEPVIPNARMWADDLQRWEEFWDWPNELIDLQGGGVGTGVMLTSFVALQAVAEVYFQCLYEKDVWKMPEERAQQITAERLKAFDIHPNAMWFRWLAPPTGSGENGEDMSFCWIAQRYAGLKVYVDTTVTPLHIGKYRYGIKDFLKHKEEAMTRARAEGRLKTRSKAHLSPIDFAPPTPNHSDINATLEEMELA